MECPFCKEEIQDDAIKCKHCGSTLNTPASENGTTKSKNIAGTLAILLGGLGIHKFYTGSWGWGIVYIIFVWSYIPAIIALVEGIRYFTYNQEEFDQKVKELNGPFGFLW